MNVMRIFMSHKLVTKVLNMFKYFMRIFSPKYFARLSRDCRASVRQSQDTGISSKLDRNSLICRINVHSVRLQRERCVYIVNLCRKIVSNYSQTSLQSLHSSEIGALEIYCYSLDI